MALLPEGPTGYVIADLQPEDTYMSIELNDNTTQTVSVKDPVWKIRVGFPPLTYSEGQELLTFLYSLKGKQTPFTVRLPQYLEPKNGPISQGTSAIAAGQVGSSLVITNWPGAVGGLPTPGDLFKLGSSNKVYLINSVDTSTPTQITLEIYPNLIVPTGSSETITFNGIEFNVRLADTQVPALSLGLDGSYKPVTLSLKEDLTP